MLKLPKVLRDLRYRVFHGSLLKCGYELSTLGDRSYGVQWTICPCGLNANSVVYIHRKPSA